MTKSFLNCIWKSKNLFERFIWVGLWEGLIFKLYIFFKFVVKFTCFNDFLLSVSCVLYFCCGFCFVLFFSIGLCFLCCASCLVLKISSQKKKTIYFTLHFILKCFHFPWSLCFVCFLSLCTPGSFLSITTSAFHLPLSSLKYTHRGFLCSLPVPRHCVAFAASLLCLCLISSSIYPTLALAFVKF